MCRQISVANNIFCNACFKLYYINCTLLPAGDDGSVVPDPAGPGVNGVGRYIPDRGGGRFRLPYRRSSSVADASSLAPSRSSVIPSSQPLTYWTFTTPPTPKRSERNNKWLEVGARPAILQCADPSSSPHHRQAGRLVGSRLTRRLRDARGGPGRDKGQAIIICFLRELANNER